MSRIDVRAAAARLRLRRLRNGAIPGPIASPIAAGDALSHLQCTPQAHRRVTLVVPTADGDAVFAGLRTAFEIAGAVAARTGAAVRVLTLDAPTASTRTAARGAIAEAVALPAERVEVATAWTATDSHPDDVWIATYYSTAHAIQRAVVRGIVHRDRVLYLVQDLESDFFPASVERAVAAETYGYGFRLLINSEPLRRSLTSRVPELGTDSDAPYSARTFRPALDVRALRSAAELRRAAGDEVRIGFYARPSKPRNAFGVGRAALQIAGDVLMERGTRLRVVTMGEAHEPFTVAGAPVEVRGRLAWADSFRALADIDVLLSLQLTPHPSHPPLDQVVSGGIAVTNDVDASRSGLSPRLLTAPTHAAALAERLVAAVDLARTTSPAPFDSALLDTLGRPLEDVVDDALEGIV